MPSKNRDGAESQRLCHPKTEIGRGGPKRRSKSSAILFLAGVGQDYAELAEDQALPFGDNEELESAAETFAVADDGAQLGDVGCDGNGKLEGDDFSGLHLTAECGADAV